jgi:hypothetical protein
MSKDFNFKKFLVENKLGPFSRLQEMETGKVIDVDGTLRALQLAVKSGADVTVDGGKIFKMPFINLATFVDGGKVQIPRSAEALQMMKDDILIDGQPLEILYKDAPPPPPTDTRSPEQKKADAQDWQDRYGPGGGYDTAFGRYTGD